MLRSINPADGKLIGEYPAHSPEEAIRRVQLAAHAFQEWRMTSFEQRAARLRSLAAALKANRDSYAALISAEMGKVLKEALAEVDKCASAAEYFANNGSAFLADQPITTDYPKSYVTFQPLGVLLAIMPWNFPFWQALRAAIPALMAGNTVVLKHASNVSGCALAMEKLFLEAGFPSHAFSVLLLPGAAVTPLIARREIAAVTLTGSTPAGREVAKAAGESLKKTVLELGGSDGYVILADADLNQAVTSCAAGRLLNCGQSCIAVKRMIVERSVRPEFERLLLERFRQHVFGDPLDPATLMGPMARADLRDGLHQQVQQSLAKGARLLTGGVIPDGPGAFYPPTILTDVKPEMPAYEEEMFGPVASIIEAADEEDALRIAADSDFGLGGGIFTRDKEKGERLARERLEAGSCFVNAAVRSDPRLPFGGVKDSGYGRELSVFGIREFVNTKAVAVA